MPSGIEGLVHISELSGNTIGKVEDVVKVGQKVEFRVIKINQEEHKLGLSLKPETLERKKEKPAQKSQQQRRERVEAPSMSSGSRAKSPLALELEKLSRNSSSEE